MQAPSVSVTREDHGSFGLLVLAIFQVFALLSPVIIHVLSPKSPLGEASLTTLNKVAAPKTTQLSHHFILFFSSITLSLSEILTCLHVAVCVSPLEGKALSFLPSGTAPGTVDMQ